MLLSTIALLALLLGPAHGDGVCDPSFPVEQDVNFINADIAAPRKNVASAAACCAACVATAGCTVFSWIGKSDLCRFRDSTTGRERHPGAVSGYTTPPPAPTPAPPTPLPPLPNARQLDFMELETIQFMHFGVPTFWDPPEEYLHKTNPTYHDCSTTSIDHSNQTAGGYYPCLNPDVFHPTDLDAEDWMRHSAAMGMKEICLTAHHEGGFALWPSNFTDYSVAASSWRGGKGDVLREFVDAANKWGIKICYYLNVQKDGYMAEVAKYSGAEFTRRQVGMLHEVLTEYGPVNRFWFDGTKGVPPGTDLGALWAAVYKEIRTTSPSTMISAYRGDVCSSTGSLYTSAGPVPNSTTDTNRCAKPEEHGAFFHPTEMHGITIQEGPDGNSDAVPTYWFWHPWACAGNVSGCPWVGHANASRIFDSYLVTVGHGAVLNMNIPPERTGRMNASVAAVMAEVGTALNDTFGSHVAAVAGASGACADGVALLDVGGAPFDYVVTMEDLAAGGQRIANYSIEFTRVGGDPAAWETLVPVLNHSKALGDRPDGHDPRDQYVGHKRIDLPVVPTSGAGAVAVAQVRFSCHRALAAPVHLRSFALHKKTVPWE
jgi:alpha-L-fucosidase